MASTELRYRVDSMSCGSCKANITEELEELGGVDGVDVDLETKLVVVRGDGLEDGSVRAAISNAGYEAVPVPAP